MTSLGEMDKLGDYFVETQMVRADISQQDYMQKWTREELKKQVQKEYAMALMDDQSPEHAAKVSAYEALMR